MIQPDQLKELLNAAKNLDVPDSLLRDWFAGQALGGLLAILRRDKKSGPGLAYDWAEAMMKERELRYYAD